MNQADEYKKTGCYDLRCPGFVHVNRDFVIGAPMPKVSVMGGRQASFLTTIWKVNIATTLIFNI